MTHSSIADGANLAADHDALLAPYAQFNATTRGRQFPQSPDPDRLPFQRDRDRIVFSAAFRRLQGKTQVVQPSGLGDHFRNRLTHSIEVAQLARDLSRQLHLNADLAESIALAHDLGHPPFGHAGEDALDQCMRQYGDHFEHNEQSLRIVDVLEQRYVDFDGLNLTYEVREGMQKHAKIITRPDGTQVFSPSLESQLVDIGDEMAYLSADLEDGLRGGFFAMADLEDLKICQTPLAQARNDIRNPRGTLIRTLMHDLVLRLVASTQHNLTLHNIQKLSDVEQTKDRLVFFTPKDQQHFKNLKDFLYQHYYNHPEIVKVNHQGSQLLKTVFVFLYNQPQHIPDAFVPEGGSHRRVCDYLAGMTNAFLHSFSKEHQLF